MKLNLKYKNKRIILNVKKCNFFEKVRGLMFRKLENAPILLFDFSKTLKYSLHSLFVFFPFLILWLDDKNEIIGFKKGEPFRFRIKTNKKFSKIIEIPISKKNKNVVENIKILVGRKI
jgi:uncharacterized membrane protein (UPF0127 family)